MKAVILDKEVVCADVVMDEALTVAKKKFKKLPTLVKAFANGHVMYKKEEQHLKKHMCAQCKATRILKDNAQYAEECQCKIAVWHSQERDCHGW
ncbi:MAG: hypothetical protein LBG88_00295 [Christensenellaceae bacterium]|jgi:hypothetical protein|nr:hypothetical protein [Christensenellaceae bacterium]